MSATCLVNVPTLRQMGSWGIQYDDPTGDQHYYWLGPVNWTGHAHLRWVWVPELSESVARFPSQEQAEHAAFTFAGPNWRRGGLRRAVPVRPTTTVPATNGVPEPPTSHP